MLDEDTATGFASEASAKGPFEIVVSLPEQSRFSRFAFDTAHVESPERGAKQMASFTCRRPLPN